MVGMIEVKPYRKPDGYRTRYWAVYVDGELLAVVLYRKGAQAIADLILATRAGKGVVNAA
jgi:hypothetical protein